MTTSPQEELRQLLANQLSPSTGSHPRNLFGPDEIPATQVHGAAAETQPYTPVPQEQELLQLRSDLTAFQSTVSAQYNNLMDLVSNIAAASSANSASAAASPANSAAASTAKSASAPAASTANYVAASTANSTAIPPTPTGSPKPSALLLAMQNFSATNPALFDYDGRNKIGTPSSLCEKIKKLKPGVWDALAGVTTCGPAAEQAIDDLKHESLAVFSAMTDCEWAAELVEALTLDPTHSVSSTVQNLLKVAVRCGTVDLIDAQIGKILSTGLFDRKLATAGDLRLEPNLQLFNPGNANGRMLWDAIGRLVTTYFSRSRSGEQVRRNAEEEYAGLTCNSHETVSTFLCSESDKYDALARTKAEYSGYTRIGLVLKMLPNNLQTAYTAFVTRRKESGEWSDARATDFDLFANDVEMIAMSLPSTSCCCDEQGDAQAADTTTGITTMTYSSKPPHKQSAGKNRFPGRTASSDHCWNHQFTGECTYGPGCRYEHVGEAGCYKSEVADGHGRCLMEIKPGGCKRKNCPFLHREEAEPQNRNTMMYPMLPRSSQLTDEQSGSGAFSVQLYYLGINTCPVY
jgi:hypothetical protein